MIEKQDTYQQDHDWKAEESNKALTSPPLVADSSWERKKGLEMEIDVAKTIHIEVTGDEWKEVNDDFPSAKSSGEAEECSEPRLTNKSRFVVQLSETTGSSQENSQSKAPSALDRERNAGMAPGSLQAKEHRPLKPRKKKRPQSLNLGMPGEFIYEKEGDGSNGEEEEGSDWEDSPENTRGTVNHPEPSSEVMMMKDDLRSGESQGKDQPVKWVKDNKQEDISAREVSFHRIDQVKSKVSQAEPADIDLGSVNGPGKAEHDTSLVHVRDECIINPQVRGKSLIDNKDLAEVKLRQVRTHERKASSSGGEDIEGVMPDKVQRRSFHRLSGSHQSEITRIVPLKPERSKSVACKDEKDRAGQEESERVMRREYRWSVGSPEGSSDMNWTDVSTFHPTFAMPMASSMSSSPGRWTYHSSSAMPKDVTQHLEAFGDLETNTEESARGPTESLLFGSKASAHPKMAPPAPPVKTQKARESGLILRNSRNASRDPGLDAAKKRHSVTLLGICFFCHWK